MIAFCIGLNGYERPASDNASQPFNTRSPVSTLWCEIAVNQAEELGWRLQHRVMTSAIDDPHLDILQLFEIGLLHDVGAKSAIVRSRDDTYRECNAADFSSKICAGPGVKIA